MVGDPKGAPLHITCTEGDPKGVPLHYMHRGDPKGAPLHYMHRRGPERGPSAIHAMHISHAYILLAGVVG